MYAAGTILDCEISRPCKKLQIRSLGKLSWPSHPSKLAPSRQQVTGAANGFPLDFVSGEEFKPVSKPIMIPD